LATEAASLAIARIPLTEHVPAEGLRALLDVVQTYHDIHAWLERVDALEHSEFPTPGELDGFPELSIDFLTIGTPNELHLKGSVAQITAIIALVAAIIALPKIPLEREQLQVSIENARTDGRLKELEALSSELSLIEKALKLHADAAISDSDLAQLTERLKRTRPNLPFAAGVLREEPHLDQASKTKAERLRVRLLERIALLGGTTPNVNLFRGVFAGDAAVVEVALRAGADPNVEYNSLVRGLPQSVTQDDEFRRILSELVYLELIR